MCGRYSFAPELKVVNEHYNITIHDGEIEPSYNCAPSQKLPVISNDAPDEISRYSWGLIPFWAKDKSMGYKLINARGETISEKPAFKNAFKKKRCLVPADAFYEWKKSADVKTKIPYRIFLPEQPVFSMAGIWDQWKSPEGQFIRSFSIVTVAPNELMCGIHNRMPLIIDPAHEREWLESDDIAGLQRLIKPFPANRMDAYRISTLVNSPKNNSPEIADRQEAE
jgi:putative SOS response-associated peptidase YedK